MSGMSIAANLRRVKEHIEEAARVAGRDSRAICLVAASKTQTAMVVREAYLAGQRDFGENYVQEALGKMAELTDLAINWHLIGTLQTNKVKLVVGKFRMIQSVDSLRLAHEISRVAVKANVTQEILLQINIGEEASKGGFLPNDFMECLPVASLPGLKVRGFMAIPQPSSEDQMRQQFVRLRNLLVKYRSALPPAAYEACCELSMGMSGDFAAAITEGATIVRIGSAIFGQRMIKKHEVS